MGKISLGQQRGRLQAARYGFFSGKVSYIFKQVSKYRQ
jgi:hypothetical protein